MMKGVNPLFQYRIQQVQLCEMHGEDISFSQEAAN